MPELPEVETIVRELQQAVAGATISSAAVYWAGSIGLQDAATFSEALSGQPIVNVTRRGKWINLALGSGQALLVHLRMTGRLLVAQGGCGDSSHIRVRLLLEDGRSICFHDMRKFGRLWLVDDARDVVAPLGPEPLGDTFTKTAFQDLLAARRARVKPLLLDQKFLAGLGNIYTDEALWRAGIHPLRPANSLTNAEVADLWEAIRTVLRRAIACGGTTLDDGGFVRTAGEPGRFAARLAVYGRAGDVCPRCGATVARIVVGQRGTHICPRCQVEPSSSGRSATQPAELD